MTCYPRLMTQQGRRLPFSIFPAHMQDRLKGSGKYWILDGIGPEFPFPLGIGTDYIPRWKRPARTLERILHEA